jgi:hypothetical protein
MIDDNNNEASTRTCGLDYKYEMDGSTLEFNYYSTLIVYTSVTLRRLIQIRNCSNPSYLYRSFYISCMLQIILCPHKRKRKRKPKAQTQQPTT